MGPSWLQGRALSHCFPTGPGFSVQLRESEGGKVWKVKGEMSEETERDGRLDYFLLQPHWYPTMVQKSSPV